MLTHQLIPGRHRGLVAGGIEHRGAAQLVGRLYPIRIGILLQMRHRDWSRWGVWCCGRRILLVRATITHRRLDVDGNTLVHMLIPVTPASAVFHARYALRSGCGWHMSKLNIS